MHLPRLLSFLIVFMFLIVLSFQEKSSKCRNFRLFPFFSLLLFVSLLSFFILLKLLFWVVVSNFVAVFYFADLSFWFLFLILSLFLF